MDRARPADATAGTDPWLRAQHLLAERLATDAAFTARWHAAHAAEVDLSITRLEQLQAGTEAMAACQLHAMVRVGGISASDLAGFGPAVLGLIDGQQAAEKVWQLHAGNRRAGA